MSLQDASGAWDEGIRTRWYVYRTISYGGTLDLLMTDVLDLLRVAVVAPMGNSDHSSLSAVTSMAQAVPNCV